MILIKDKKMCSGCSACSNVCPQKCIEMVSDSEGFVYPIINTSKCINCNRCEKSCPIINKTSTQREPHAYAAYSLNDEIISNSSSGGIFSELALQVLNAGGIIFGAALDENYNLKHIYIDSQDNLYKLQGSKYFQSNIGDSFACAKKFLDSGKTVLFSGTPCQIEGLLSFLNKKYDNLITQDIICHGVPSPLAWKKYFEHISSNSEVKRVNFRDKKLGWKNFSLKISFSDGTEQTKSLSEDLFMKGFLADLYLRPSCYSCSFKSLKRRSDITLADFWGIQYICPEMHNEQGVSLTFINSEKGKELWKKIEPQIKYKEVDLNASIKYNSAAIKSPPENKYRKTFFEKLTHNSFVESIDGCLPEKSFFQKLSIKLKLMMKKLK